MAQNKQTDLNNHLFAQLERLSDENLKGEALEAEIHRTKAITDVSKQIVSNASLALRAQRLIDDGQVRCVPEQFDQKPKLKAVPGGSK